MQFKTGSKSFLFLLRGTNAYKSNAGLYWNFIAAVKFIRTIETTSYLFFCLFALTEVPLILKGLCCEDIVTHNRLL